MNSRLSGIHAIGVWPLPLFYVPRIANSLHARLRTATIAQLGLANELVDFVIYNTLGDKYDLLETRIA